MTLNPNARPSGRTPNLKFRLATSELHELFDSETWDRARGYVGAFSSTQASPREIRGEVTGHHGTYTTFLRRVGDSLECACSCLAASEMNCKHSAALGLTYLRDSRSFQAMAARDRIEIRALKDVHKFLERTTLEDLVEEIRDRGITQKQVVQILGINAGLFGSAKRLEKRGRRYGFLNACKLACAYLLGIIEQGGLHR